MLERGIGLSWSAILGVAVVAAAGVFAGCGSGSKDAGRAAGAVTDAVQKAPGSEKPMDTRAGKTEPTAVPVTPSASLSLTAYARQVKVLGESVRVEVRRVGSLMRSIKPVPSGGAQPSTKTKSLTHGPPTGVRRQTYVNGWRTGAQHIQLAADRINALRPPSDVPSVIVDSQNDLVLKLGALAFNFEVNARTLADSNYTGVFPVEQADSTAQAMKAVEHNMLVSGSPPDEAALRQEAARAEAVAKQAIADHAMAERAMRAMKELTTKVPADNKRAMQTMKTMAAKRSCGGRLGCNGAGTRRLLWSPRKRH